MHSRDVDTVDSDMWYERQTTKDMKNQLTAYSLQVLGRKKSGRAPLQAASYKLQAGFTLVEMIVAIGLFSVVMVVSVGALLSLVTANRKAQSLQSVMNNLNIALDGMARTVRMGNEYDGSAGCTENVAGPKDCTGGSTTLSFQPYGDAAEPAWIYNFNGVTHSIERSTSGSISGAAAITAPEVTVDDMRFYVVGTERGDTVQPKVVIVVKGSAGAPGSSARTTFHIQAAAVQRVLDL